MKTLFAVLEFKDYAIIAGLVTLFGGGARYVTRRDMERRLRSLDQKLDALLQHQGVPWPPPAGPSGLSLEVEQLASNPATKIAAIKRYREENPGVGLSEAKEKIEAFNNGRL